MEISITNKHGNFTVLIDDEDWYKIKNVNLTIDLQKNDKFRVRFYIKGKPFKLHRYLLNITDSKLQVDHINGNPLDNRKENLRICSNRDNSRNQSLKKINTSGYKGVTWNKRLNRWQAQIMVDYKNKVLGQFINKIDAAKAYNEAAIKYYGEFAGLNKIL